MAKLNPGKSVGALFTAGAALLFASGCTGELKGTAQPGGGAQGSSVGGTSSAGTGNTAGTGATSGASGTSSSTGGSAGTGGMIDPNLPTPPAPANPGSVTARRLNRVEYNNTVHDLLGTSLTPADSFQADAIGAGFDTVGAALSLSPTAARDYEDAAYKLIDELMAAPARLSTVVPCDVQAEGEACLRTSLTAFATRAFRRPATTAEVDVLLAPFRTAEMLGAARTLGVRAALAAVLVSPHFLFRLEIDPDPTSPAPRRLTDYEIASRLSYALWSTMPDTDLFASAQAGTLQTDAELARQIDRMLADPHADALSENFAGQWLGFRDIDVHEANAQVFPTYSPALAASMHQEATLFFQDFLATQRPVAELLSARFTFVDSALATHYGLPVMTGMQPGQMWRADTTAVPRSGLLTLGAVLTATSFSTRTSPVKRGEFVLRRILCETVTPPPPDVIGIPDEIDPNQQLTMRQRMEQHRNNDMCIGCHVDMDQLGFGLENYDAVGAYRTLDNGLPVDSNGVLPDMTPFSGAVELSALLSRDARFNSCVAKNLMTFALGRYLDQPDDAVWVAHIAGTARDTGGHLGTLIRTVLKSETFRSRQAVVLR